MTPDPKDALKKFGSEDSTIGAVQSYKKTCPAPPTPSSLNTSLHNDRNVCFYFDFF